MNNAFINKEYEDVSDKALPILREQVTHLTEVIEALQNIQGSSYWKVLEKYVFNVELIKSKRRLEKEGDTLEIFRLQGEIRLGRRYDLEKLTKEYREKLSVLRKKINA